MAMISVSNLTLLLTALTTALIAGLYYAYSCSVNPGLSKLGDTEYVAAMQSINVAIVNPVFMFGFLGTVLLLPLSTYFAYRDGFSLRFWLLGAATLVYLAGSFGVTVFGNVPLNNMLADFDLQSASRDIIASQRIKFEQPWNRLHNIRTWASVLWLILVVLACIDKAE